jgi:hypothetical protein
MLFAFLSLVSERGASRLKVLLRELSEKARRREAKSSPCLAIGAHSLGCLDFSASRQERVGLVGQSCVACRARLCWRREWFAKTLSTASTPDLTWESSCLFWGLALTILSEASSYTHAAPPSRPPFSCAKTLCQDANGGG